MTALEILSQGLVGKTIKLWRYTNDVRNKYYVQKPNDNSPIDNVQYLKINNVFIENSCYGGLVITVKGDYGYSSDFLDLGKKEITFYHDSKLTFV